jgi:CheY-like chemotaxis protein
MSKVLVYVDDAKDDLFLFSAACRMAHLRSRLVPIHGGLQAIRYLDRRDIYADRDQFPDPDILLVDVKMPEVDGFEVLQHLRSDPARVAWPVGLLTSSDWPNDIEQARRLGATWYFRKPPDMKVMIEFAATLDACMEQSPAACEAAARLSIFSKPG